MCGLGVEKTKAIGTPGPATAKGQPLTDFKRPEAETVTELFETAVTFSRQIRTTYDNL